MSDQSFDAVVIGTGFASSFFLLEYLRHAESTARVLVLERGKRYKHAWQLEHRAHSDVSFDALIKNRTPRKPWIQNIAFGGGACWLGNTPRMHPSDFRTKSRYDVGDDWPIDYDTLEPFYVQAEEVMGIAGSAEGPFPRSRPYPLPAHRINALDEAFAKKYPGLHVPMPSARASTAAAGRSVCCANGICSNCPIGAKFQVDLHMARVFEDPRVTVRTEAPCERLEIQGDRVVGVHYRSSGTEQFAKCDLAAVGAHAIMTPFLLLKSGLDDPALGHYLNEQFGVEVDVLLDGVQNYGGSQAVTGLGVMFLDGDFRSQRPGCLVENWNVPWLRAEAGRWRERGFLKFVFEDVPSFDNTVTVSASEPDKPEVYHPKHTPYLERGLSWLRESLDELFEGLPIEGYHVHPLEGLGAEAHIQGTVRMGDDPKTSVVDRHLRHHRVRNLLALGSGVFTTCPAANPTLTLSALSLWAAKNLFG